MAAVKKATRKAFGEALARLGEAHTNVVVLDADLSKSTMSMLFAKKHPDRFFQMGIQEANMIGTAAGLALGGKVPFCCSFACFLTGRFDQIRVSVGYSQANVRLVGTHAGVGIGEDGYSQMGLEDLALMRSLPNMLVLQPADDLETEQMVEHLIAHHQGPAYLRLTRQEVERVHGDGYRWQPGKAEVLREGSDLALLATGGTVMHALRAAEALAGEGVSVRVVNVGTLKPLDTALLLQSAQKCGKVVTAEDHMLTGGLGSAVAEALAEHGVGAPLVRIAVREYGESGSPEALYRKHGLDAEGIARRVRELLGGRARGEEPATAAVH